MLGFQDRGAVVFDNGNLIRTQAKAAGVERAFEIPVFTEAFLRPLFCRGIGPFRWIALSNDPADIARSTTYVLERFRRQRDRHELDQARARARSVPRSAGAHRLARPRRAHRPRLAVNAMVRDGKLRAPIAFTRDHLDAGAMAHPNIMTENMRDGSDAIADWPLLNAMVHCASQADLVAIHSGGGGYCGLS